MSQPCESPPDPSRAAATHPCCPSVPPAAQQTEGDRGRSAAERRRATRYASGQSGSCRPAADTEGLEAQVKDVSVGGIDLLAPRRFEKGTLIFLKLGGADTSRLVSVLVRVVRLAAQSNGRWLIGCAFVSETSEEEILACREVAPQAGQLGESPPDRRAWLRLPCYVLTVCRPGVPASSGRWPVEVRDVSAGGLELVVPAELEQASALRVALPALDGLPRKVRVRVRRRTRLDNNKWLLGCEFCQDPSGEGTAAREVRSRPARGSGSSRLTQVLSRVTSQVPAQQRGWEQELAGHPERLAELVARVRQSFSELVARVRQSFSELAEQVVAELRAQADRPAPQSRPSSSVRSA